MKTKKTITKKVLLLAFLAVLLVSCSNNDNQKLKEDLKNNVWVCYNPPKSNPDLGIEASEEDIITDLDTLIKYGFTGIITYGSSGILGEKLPGICQEKGLKLIMGVWDINDSAEFGNVVKSSDLECVVGICLGNEGLNERYTFEELQQAVIKYRKATRKPLTTSEQIEDYYTHTELLTGGNFDFIFPIVHPFFHGIKNPKSAAEWVEKKYEELSKKTKLPVLLKETGMPTAGSGGMNEQIQSDFYANLNNRNVCFAYFESYDNPFKAKSSSLSYEASWGLFDTNRVAKLFVRSGGLNRYLTIAENQGKDTKQKKTADVFYVYHDGGSALNHFYPTGFMGDVGDLALDQFCQEPYYGESCIKVTYLSKGLGPNECSYQPCKWSGIYWLVTPDFWGKQNLNKGYDLNAWHSLTFAARANRNTQVEFKVAGIDEPYGDSQKVPVEILASLTTKWKEYTIDLRDADLTNIIGGFCIVTNMNMNPTPVDIYIDEIRYEK
ncbi:MAG TPA: hypothetical protein PKW80_04245 [Bacteroidales bacterium]|nr:hypothetical protein [Bacteroidales bacterium]